ncbi:hypothetical protein R9C00_14955 [Flammeovirgaceae bacterium SG7u.111]|nr:hypothetical protein [Flammeovirgaceae bacterium SG7u.132]WPO33000.1 hypothetical protein R9C00_14955 [Flammeovirgaceae bacterium SG7u.111]
MKLFLTIFSITSLVIGVGVYHSFLEKRDLEAYLADKCKKAEVVGEIETADLVGVSGLEEEKLEIYEVLKEKFIQDKDDEASIWYYHKRWGLKLPKGTGLAAHLNENGELYLVSHYTGAQSLDHTQILVRVGDQVIDSTLVPRVATPRLAAQSGEKYEFIRYGGEKDRQILQLIAENTDKEIWVRFLGDSSFEDMVLDEESKTAIRESVEMYQLFKS